MVNICVKTRVSAFVVVGLAGGTLTQDWRPLSRSASIYMVSTWALFVVTESIKLGHNT